MTDAVICFIEREEGGWGEKELLFMSLDEKWGCNCTVKNDGSSGVAAVWRKNELARRIPSVVLFALPHVGLRRMWRLPSFSIYPACCASSVSVSMWIRDSLQATSRWYKVMMSNYPLGQLCRPI